MHTEWACKIEMREFQVKCEEVGSIPGWGLYGECRVKTIEGARRLLAERLDSPFTHVERFTDDEITFSDQTGHRYRFQIIPMTARA